jgi:hypothetical protein
LVLVLHGCAHGRVSHDVHDREQVLGRPIHFSSKAMTRTVEDEVIWQPGLLPDFGEPAWSAGKGPGDDVRGGIVDWSISRRHVWLLDRFKDHVAQR